MTAPNNSAVAGNHSGLDQMLANTDKTHAFKQARRHSYLVKLLKLVLPLSAMALLSLVVLPALVPQSTGLTFKKVEAVNLTSYIMHNPHYEGFDKKNGNYVIDAATAQIDIKNTGSVPLTKLKVSITHIDDTSTIVTAQKGFYDRDEKKMDLEGGIQFHNSTGMSAFFETAKINMATKMIQSDKPVRVEMPQGKVTSNAIKIYGQRKYVEFIDDVKLFLVAPPEPKNSNTKNTPKKAKKNPLGGGMSFDRSLPILSQANFLAINDKEKTTLLTGNVTVKQGQYELLTNNLLINYSQPAKKGATKKDGASSIKGASGKIKSIHASKGIVIYTADGRSIQGESALFNLAEEKVKIESSAKNQMKITSKTGSITSRVMLLENAKNHVSFDGKVVASMGKNIIRADHLKMNTKTNRVNFDGHVSLIAYNQKKKGKKRSKRKNKKSGLKMNANSLDPNKPISIKARHLTINDKKKRAIFKGKVIAKQDNFSVRAEKLTAYYTGKMQPMATTSTQASKKKNSSKNDGQIKKIIARTKVLITSGKDQTVSGDKAIFNVRTNMAEIIGNVVLSQKGNILKGERLVLNLNTGHYTLKNSKHSRVKLLVMPGSNKSFKMPR